MPRPRKYKTAEERRRAQTAYVRNWQKNNQDKMKAIRDKFNKNNPTYYKDKVKIRCNVKNPHQHTLAEFMTRLIALEKAGKGQKPVEDIAPEIKQFVKDYVRIEIKELWLSVEEKLAEAGEAAQLIKDFKARRIK